MIDADFSLRRPFDNAYRVLRLVETLAGSHELRFGF
ncbi:Uncharacterised protein [Vibrio cholerae]|nr:Uncharacterised protein [Vibrio cholerae]